MIEIMIDLQGGAKAPLYEKIYEYIKKEIVEGKMTQGEKLPSTRRLSENLAVSRSTVEMAYDQLLAEGYIKAEPCRGFFVCDITELYRLEKQVSAPKSYEREKKAKKRKVDFSPYAIDTGNFPYNIWRKINKNILLDDSEDLLLSGDGQGEYELRSAIAAYLHQARGVNCSPEEIIIGAGNEYLEILLAQLLGREGTLLMENPGYPRAYYTFLNMGYTVKTVPTAEGGLTLDNVCRENPDLIYMMPSHQFPMGTVMPLKQRLELLKWASEAENRYLIEDDHDSEFRYRGKPIPSLQSIDCYGRVVYLGTFSKSIAPSLRISYMVLPPQLMEKYHSECGFYSTTVPRMQQEVLREFIEQGHFERHLNKMRGIYRSRHDYLLGELKKCSWVKKISGDYAGLHLLVQVDTVLSEEELCNFAAEKGVRVSGISKYLFPEAQSRKEIGKELQAPTLAEPVLLLGYGKLSEREVRHGLELLGGVVREA